MNQINVKKPYLLYVGNAFPHKNIKRLIKAFEVILRSKPSIKLVLVGEIDNFYKSFYILCKELKIEKNVVFTGKVLDEELKWLYQNASIYVFPSFLEGFGLPGLEAMENGLPVVSSDSSCLTEIYGDAALYFNPQNIEEIVKAVLELLDNKELREKLIKKGYKRVKKFSWRKCAQETLEIYRSVLS